MSDLIDRLEEVIRDHILGVMPADSSGRLRAESLADLLISYGTWRSRLIPARPRRCHLSRELQASPKAVEHKASLDAIIAKIEAGDDLGPHLSKAAEANQGRDRMLADFGVHHLHLSTSMAPGGRYVTRGNNILFASFKPDDAYLIGIYEHVDDWARKDILATAARNWPDAGIVHELQYVIGLTREFNDADRLELQKAGISVGAIEVDGKVFTTLGQTLAGTPYSASQLMMTVMHTLREWREHVDERLAETAVAVDRAAGRKVAGEWTPTVHEEVAGLQREDVFCGIVALS
jgi:hypothetical protein